MILILLFLIYQFLVSLVFYVRMSTYGLIVMVLGCCVSNTAAIHTGDAGSSP